MQTFISNGLYNIIFACSLLIQLKTVRNILLAFAFISSTSAYAQFDEVGIEGGIANYFGDLNIGSSFKDYKPAAGVFYRRNLSPHFAWKSNLNAGQLAFDSKLNSNAYWQYQNLNFRATFAEATTVMEFNFFKYKSNKIKDCRWSPFVFFGFGMMYYDLQAKYDDKWISLPPLETEGKAYNTLLFVLPMGGGLKFNIAKSITLEIEEVYHHTYSDHLDDVSSTYTGKAIYVNNNPTNIADPSNPANPLSHLPGKQRGEQFKDKYLLTFISLSYTFHTPHCPNPDVDDGFEIFDK